MDLPDVLTDNSTINITQFLLILQYNFVRSSVYKIISPPIQETQQIWNFKFLRHRNKDLFTKIDFGTKVLREDQHFKILIR